MPQADVITNGAYMLLVFPTFIAIGFILSAVIESFDIEDRLQNFFDVSNKTDKSCFNQETVFQKFLEEMRLLLLTEVLHVVKKNSSLQSNFYNAEKQIDPKVLAEVKQPDFDLSLVFKSAIIESYVCDALASEWDFGVTEDGKLKITRDILDDFKPILEEKNNT